MKCQKIILTPNLGLVNTQVRAAWRERLKPPDFPRLMRLIFCSLRGEIFRGKIPVHHVPERGDIIGAGIAVIHVIGVFPHVAGKQGLLACGERAGGIAGADNGQRAILVFHQPCPT